MDEATLIKWHKRLPAVRNIRVQDRHRSVATSMRFVAFARVSFQTATVGRCTWTYEGYGRSETEAREDLFRRIKG